MLSGASREEPSLPPLDSGVPWLHHPTLCFPLHMAFSLFLCVFTWLTSYTEWVALPTPVWLNYFCKQSYFQIRSHYEVLRDKTSTYLYFFANTIQPITRSYMISDILTNLVSLKGFYKRYMSRDVLDCLLLWNDCPIWIWVAVSPAIGRHSIPFIRV